MHLFQKMKLILILATSFIQIVVVSPKRYRAILDDDLYPYRIAENVSQVKEYFSIETLIFEQIDDDQVKYGGYGTCIKSMDPHLILQASLITQYEENAIWREGPIRVYFPNICTEFVDPTRWWYNITKLWTKCPPQAGDKWFIEEQISNIVFEFPSSLAKNRWRAYYLLHQGIVRTVTKLGAMFQVELVEVV